MHKILVWMAFSGDRMSEIHEKLARLRTVTPPRCFDSEDGLAVMLPILLAAGVDKRFIIENSVHQIAELVEELGAAEGYDTALEPILTDYLSKQIESDRASKDELMTREIKEVFGIEKGFPVPFRESDTACQWVDFPGVGTIPSAPVEKSPTHCG